MKDTVVEQRPVPVQERAKGCMISMAANDEERDKGTGKKKKAKSTPKKERQISLRLSPKGAKRLSQLTDKTEWSVTQVIEEALKVYAAQENIHVDDRSDAEDSEKERQ